MNKSLCGKMKKIATRNNLSMEATLRRTRQMMRCVRLRWQPSAVYLSQITQVLPNGAGRNSRNKTSTTQLLHIWTLRLLGFLQRSIISRKRKQTINKNSYHEENHPIQISWEHCHKPHESKKFSTFDDEN